MDMKKYLPALLVVLLPMLTFAEELKRADGTTLKATVVRAEPDGLVVQTDSGVEKIDFVFLSDELQKRFKYDAAKAREYHASQVAAHQQAVSQKITEQMAAIRAQAQAIDQKQSQLPSPAEAERRILIEKSVIFATATVEQGTSKGVRAGLTVLNGRAAATMLDKDTRTTTSLGEGFIYGLEGSAGESWQGKIYPAGYFHYTDSFGEEQTIRAYALTVEDAMTHGADGHGPSVPSVDPTAVQRLLPNGLRGGTLLDK